MGFEFEQGTTYRTDRTSIFPNIIQPTTNIGQPTTDAQLASKYFAQHPNPVQSADTILAQLPGQRFKRKASKRKVSKRKV